MNEWSVNKDYTYTAAFMWKQESDRVKNDAEWMQSEYERWAIWVYQMVWPHTENEWELEYIFKSIWVASRFLV